MWEVHEIVCAKKSHSLQAKVDKRAQRRLSLVKERIFVKEVAVDVSPILPAWRENKQVNRPLERVGGLEGRTSEQTGGRTVREGTKVQTGPEDGEGRTGREGGRGAAYVTHETWK